MADSVIVTIPVAEPVEGAYQPTRIDFRLDAKEAETSRRIYDGLCLSGAELSPGKYVESHTDVYRWWLEMVRGAIVVSKAEGKSGTNRRPRKSSGSAETENAR